MDADFTNGSDWRVVQMTPPGSPTSVMFGKGFTTAARGSLQGTFLVVDDVDAGWARRSWLSGAEVSEVFHFENNLLRVVDKSGRAPGPDPKRASYFWFASFADPDGNSWLLQGDQGAVPGTRLQLRRRLADNAAEGGGAEPWHVRADGAEAPLVGLLRRLHRGA